MLDLRQKDKQLHLLAGIVLTATMYPLIGLWAFFAAIAIGLIKEFVIDELRPAGVPDIWDAAATALGALLVIAFLWITALL